MKKIGNASTLDSTLILPTNIKDDLDYLKNTLRNNLDFFCKVIQECMKIGKKESIFFDRIEKMLYEEYPELTTYNDGYKLIEKTYEFTGHLCDLTENRDGIENLIEQVYLIGDNE